MEAVLFVEYPKCSTCKKAKKWLDEHGIPYTDRHIVEDNPSSSELKSWQEKSGLPLRRFFKIYVRDFPGASDLRVQLMETTTTDEARTMIDAFEASHDFF